MSAEKDALIAAINNLKQKTPPHRSDFLDFITAAKELLSENDDIRELLDETRSMLSLKNNLLSEKLEEIERLKSLVSTHHEFAKGEFSDAYVNGELFEQTEKALSDGK